MYYPRPCNARVPDETHGCGWATRSGAVPGAWEEYEIGQQSK